MVTVVIGGAKVVAGEGVDGDTSDKPSGDAEGESGSFPVFPISTHASPSSVHSIRFAMTAMIANRLELSWAEPDMTTPAIFFDQDSPYAICRPYHAEPTGRSNG
ncbi:hypothetical protein [Amycolatopsis xylanica]|uniref:hypothetical protein n=1 Tax=Amycolatopsis xylanica TaxID=589385 RepID=UPI00115FFD80|nr:hypothetical protein [Amycolatopsis xylanica]